MIDDYGKYSPIIEANGLGCLIGRQYLLHNINWKVYKGEKWVVFGMNGSGKTTLLSTIAGYRSFTHGHLRIFGNEYSQDNILDLRRKIGWVSSSYFDQYYKNETALNIVLTGKFGTLGLRGDITNDDLICARRLFGIFRLEDKINQPYRMMSKGERQNVLIMRAFFGNPEILILDEPCSGLDVLARDHLLDITEYLAEHTNITIIFVTHYSEEILPIFDKTILLSHGRIYAQGNSKDIFKEKILQKFLSYPVSITPQDKGRFKINAQVERSVMEELKGVLV